MAYAKIKSVIDGMARLTHPPKELKLGRVIKLVSLDESDGEPEKDDKEKEPEDESSLEGLRDVIQNKFYSHRAKRDLDFHLRLARLTSFMSMENHYPRMQKTYMKWAVPHHSET